MKWKDEWVLNKIKHRIREEKLGLREWCMLGEYEYNSIIKTIDDILLPFITTNPQSFGIDKFISPCPDELPRYLYRIRISNCGNGGVKLLIKAGRERKFETTIKLEDEDEIHGRYNRFIYGVRDFF